MSPATTIAATLASVWAIAGLVWVARKRLPFEVCPICLGVAGTWLWMAALRYAGLAVDSAMLAVLLGGSAVGIAYTLEKRLPPSRSPVVWKALSIPAGFVAAYGVARPDRLALWIGVAGLALLTLAFLPPRRTPSANSEAVESIKEQMKRCC